MIIVLNKMHTHSYQEYKALLQIKSNTITKSDSNARHLTGTEKTLLTENHTQTMQGCLKTSSVYIQREIFLMTASFVLNLPLKEII